MLAQPFAAFDASLGKPTGDASSPEIGMRSTYDVKCAVLSQSFEIAPDGSRSTRFEKGGGAGSLNLKSTLSSDFPLRIVTLEDSVEASSTESLFFRTRLKQ